MCSNCGMLSTAMMVAGTAAWAFGSCDSVEFFCDEFLILIYNLSLKSLGEMVKAGLIG